MSDASRYLKLPYRRVLVPDDDSGTFTAIVPELPGCVAQGDDPGEAYANLEDAAEAWIESALDLGQDIPLPGGGDQHSGRILLRLPRSTHRRLAEAAQEDGTSLNQFLLAALSEKLGTRSATATAVVAERKGRYFEYYVPGVVQQAPAAQGLLVLPKGFTKFSPGNQTTVAFGPKNLEAWS